MTRAIHQSGPTSGTGMRRPRRAACRAVIAPLATTFTGSARRRSAAATKALATTVSSTTANGGSASTLNGTAGIRSTRPSGLGTCGPRTVPIRIAPDAHADAAADGVGRALDVGEHVAIARTSGSTCADSSGRVGAPWARP